MFFSLIFSEILIWVFRSQNGVSVIDFLNGIWWITHSWFERASRVVWQIYCHSRVSSHRIFLLHVSGKLELRMIVSCDSILNANIGLAKKSPKILRTKDVKIRENNFIGRNTIDTIRKSKIKALPRWFF